jgi:hypothetical protein
VSFWFSEKDVIIGAQLLRAIDKGLSKSRSGIAPVTPALLAAVDASLIKNSELLARDQLIPVGTGRRTRLAERSALCSAREAA